MRRKFERRSRGEDSWRKDVLLASQLLAMSNNAQLSLHTVIPSGVRRRPHAVERPEPAECSTDLGRIFTMRLEGK